MAVRTTGAPGSHRRTGVPLPRTIDGRWPLPFHRRRRCTRRGGSSTSRSITPRRVRRGAPGWPRTTGANGACGCARGGRGPAGPPVRTPTARGRRWASARSTPPATRSAGDGAEGLCGGGTGPSASVRDGAGGAWLRAPRGAKSAGTRLNRQRVANIEAAGWMTDAGRRAVGVARANGFWMIYDPVEDLLEPADLAAALDADGVARANWNGFPPSARKAMLWWVIGAGRAETRPRRIASIVEHAAIGQRAQS